MYAQRFGRATQLPLAVMVCTPVVILVLVAAVLTRALERAKQKYVEREANGMMDHGVTFPLAVTNGVDHSCTDAKIGHSEVSGKELASFTSISDVNNFCTDAENVTLG